MRKLSGKSREQIDAVLKELTRSELLDLVASHVAVEQMLKPSEIAARCRINKRAVLREIREGKFGPYICRAENSIIVPASGVNAWLRRFTVTPTERRG